MDVEPGPNGYLGKQQVEESALDLDEEAKGRGVSSDDVPPLCLQDALASVEHEGVPAYQPEDGHTPPRSSHVLVLGLCILPAAGHQGESVWHWMKHGWFTNAGSQADAGLTSAAAQVGQVMLTLPHAGTPYRRACPACTALYCSQALPQCRCLMRALMYGAGKAGFEHAACWCSVADGHPRRCSPDHRLHDHLHVDHPPAQRALPRVQAHQGELLTCVVYCLTQYLEQIQPLLLQGVWRVLLQICWGREADVDRAGHVCMHLLKSRHLAVLASLLSGVCMASGCTDQGGQVVCARRQDQAQVLAVLRGRSIPCAPPLISLT